MPSLCITDVDAVEEDGDLLGVAAADAYIGQGSQRTFLPDIDSGGIFQQIIYTLYRRRLDILTAQYSYHSRLLTDCQRCARSRHVHFL